MVKDLLNKGAILQRDKCSYAIVPQTPAGIISPGELQRIVDVARKYGVEVLKFTSAQRIAIVGLKEEDLDNAWLELEMEPASAIGKCVRSIKVCPGTTFCKRAQQDAVSLGSIIDDKYHGVQLPSKFKMAVSGCMNSCSEPAVKDIGIMGTPRGYTVMVGGNAGIRPRLGDVISEGLNETEVLELIEKIIGIYKGYAKRYRIGRLIDDMGLDNFKKELGLI
ncbi:sulfite reductase [Methanococcoides methylutens]|uniref:Sulfite reductase n=1 Tax=Methanococcoides methylutens TaxID=2226 RepID=A0A099T5N9_METMT|nr:NAD(P)/FAD-dependent oxidoreductase [Methanococcoides methylutens]KGK99511.1 sulfite reductase [Methanococcoides methylutens]